MGALVRYQLWLQEKSKYEIAAFGLFFGHFATVF